MKVLITGATGLIGSKIAAKCKREGIEVHYLTTRKEQIENEPGYTGFYWNPQKDEIDTACFKDVDSIIHLAGATIAKRWTDSYKKIIIESRVNTAKVMFNSLKDIDHKVSHFISASGIGIYPNSETTLYTEESTEKADNFLAEVVTVWEGAANEFRQLGMDVALVRTGMVLDKHDGAFPKLVKPIRLGVGSPLGSGDQWQSWIHIADIVHIYLYILENDLEGVYNAVATTPVTNSKLVRDIANRLDVPVWLPNVPAFVLKLALGEMAVLVLEGQLVSSKKLEKSGFVFKYGNIKSATKNLL